MSKLTSIILACNEYELLPKCIENLSFSDEIIVIDDSSTDRISQIAKKLGAKVYKRALNNDFAAQRNFALTKAKYDWVLFVDVDERISKKLTGEIKEVIKENSVAGYYIKRKDIWMGKHLKYGEFGEACLLRLAQKNKGHWVRAVHEHWLIDGRTATLKNHMLHYPHPSVSEFIAKINHYAQLHAGEIAREGKPIFFLRIIINPVGKFLVSYFLKLGFLDGMHGFVAAVIMSMHSFLAWSTIWSNKNYSKYNAS